MDWRLYKAIYGLSLHHHWLGSLFHAIEQASIPFVIVITVALWLFARPGGSRKWKLAATAGLLSAGLALAINKAIATAWFRERPFVAHRIAHPWINSHDASFPSDHASASFAIATAVMLIDPLIGGLFLLVALIVSVGRLLIGAHYPGDVATGLLIGVAAGVIVTRPARRVVSACVAVVERVTDPILRPIWRRVRT